MIRDDDRSDLPTLREEARDLPVLLPGSKPHHERAAATAYPAWSSLASQRHIHGLAPSPKTGGLWLATAGGVLHWHPDLKTFTRYGSEHGLAGNKTTALAIHGYELVWAAHEQGGISYLDGAVWRPYIPLNKTVISCLHVDKTGRLWIGTAEGIYAIANPDSEPIVELPFTGDPPRSLLVAENGDLWLCNARGIFHHQGDDWTLAIARTDILALASCGHQLWVGAMSELVLIDLATTKMSRVNTCPAGEVTALAPTVGGVWVACGGQVGLATPTSWTPFGRGQRLRTRVTTLASSNEDEVWIGTHEGLLYGTQKEMRLHLTDMPPDVIGRSSTDPQTPPATLSNLIQALAIQRKEQGSVVWIGTPAGLFCLDLSTESWKRYSHPGLHDIRALTTSVDGNTLWAASWSSGLYRVVKDHVTLELSADVCGPLIVLAVGPDSTCWVAGLQGLYQYKGEGSWACVLPEHKLPRSGWIRTISQSSPTRVWVGTTDGLFSYHPMKEVLLPMSGTPLANADIRCLLSLMHGQSEYLWVGTNAGLYSGPPSGLQKLPDLAGRAISALLWDSHSHIVWVGTDKGLFSLIKRAANEWVIAKELTSDNSGLAADRVTALALSNDAQGKRELWIGTPCGLSCYRY